MANLEIKAEEILDSFVIEYDLNAVAKDCFGVFQWRIKIARLCFLMAEKVLRVRVQARNA